MLDKEICIRLKPGDWVKRTWFWPAMAIILFALTWVLIYAPWSSDGAPAWVQAVGSVAAIFVAIAIASAQRRADRLKAQQLAQEQDLGRASVLYYAVYEASKSIERLSVQFAGEANIPPSLAYMYEQMLVRYGHIFIGDLDPTRIKIATRLRYDLSVLIIALRDVNVLGRESIRTAFSNGSKHFAELMDLAAQHRDEVEKKAKVEDR